MDRLLTWQECGELGIKDVQRFYRDYVSSSQVDLISSFGFGRVTATSAEGMYIHTSDGRRILDFTGGIGVLGHGHNHPRILAARIDFQRQMRMEVHKNFLSPYVAGLSHNIAQLLPDDLDISYFCNSGAEAVEGALKLAYKYFEGERNYVLHADISFHGKLLGAASVTGSPELTFRFPQISNVGSFEYDEIESVRTAVADLRKESGESDIYAIIVEPLSGSSLRECSGSFLEELREICTNEGIILIFDEVYTGWGKTGHLFHFMKHQVVPDIVTMAKTFGGGKSSIAGYVTRSPVFRRAYDNLEDATLHSTTYNAFGEECATAIEAINIIVEDEYVARAARIHERVNAGLAKLKTKYPSLIEDVRGSGVLNGIVLNGEVNSAVRQAFRFVPASFVSDERFIVKLITSSVISELFNSHGILTFFGSNREIPLIVSPSLVVSHEQIDQFLHALDETLGLGKLRLVTKFVRYRFLGV